MMASGSSSINSMPSKLLIGRHTISSSSLFSTNIIITSRKYWNYNHHTSSNFQLIHLKNNQKNFIFIDNNNNNKKKQPFVLASSAINGATISEEKEYEDNIGTSRQVNYYKDIKKSSSIEEEEEEEEEANGGREMKMGLKEYLEESKEMVMRSSSDGGPPRWFSPIECATCDHLRSPLLLFLPGIDGVGMGLILQYHGLTKIFDIWCLHIPVTDRTPFTDLVGLVERTVRLENTRLPNRPIYIVAESVGACLALSIAARNPDIDLVLILANSATCFEKSPLQPILPLLQFIPEQFNQTLPFALASLTGIPLKLVMSTLEKRLGLQEAVGELSKSLGALSSYVNVLANTLVRRETLMWKLQMLREASTYVNSRLHAVKAQTLILSSGRDVLLPSEEEGERLRRILPKSEIRRFSDCGHALFLEEDVDLVTIIKGASFYRRAKHLDYVSDYMPPTDSEFNKIYENFRLIEVATAPVMLSTLENGNIVKGLSGIPSEGPVLFVGYHMLLGLELAPMIAHLYKDRNILMRGVGHPMMFRKLRDGRMPELSAFDVMRLMGAVPVSPTNLYKLFASNSHVLLYPGGVREALHRKGEEYKLFWPEQAEFVRMAAKFGATIVPFGVVGEDDISQIILDYDDLMKIPYLKNAIAELTEEAGVLRTDSKGEVTNQDVHMPVMLPKLPGRFYYLFGKPIRTKGRQNYLANREESHKLYLEVKSEVENCIAFLKEKREHDPYRDLSSRLFYQSVNGFDSQIPTFEV